MSVNAIDWALRFAPVDAKHNGPARVLMCLANVADDAGRNAHPPQRKLAAWCQCSLATIKRHLSWLEHNGLIRRGDQRLVSHFSEGHRPVVWDLCLDNRIKPPSDFWSPDDIDTAKGGRPAGHDDDDENPSSTMSRGCDEKPIEEPFEKPQLNHEPGFTAVSPPPAHLLSYSTSLVRNPSAPMGHLPASGETPPETKTEPEHHELAGSDRDGRAPTPRETRLWLDPHAMPAPGDELPVGAGKPEENLVCRALEAGWSKPPAMPTPRPVAGRHQRERRAARRLIDRHGLETVVKVALWATSPVPPDARSVSGGRPYDGFWRTAIAGVRTLETNWDRIIAQMADDRTGRTTLARLGLIRDTPPASGTGTVPGTCGPMDHKPNQDVPAPNYGIPDQLDRRVDRLLEPHDATDGNDGWQARRVLRQLLKTIPDTDPRGEQDALHQALESGRRRLQAEQREQERQDNKPAKPATYVRHFKGATGVGATGWRITDETEKVS